ncbi:hypothetical protein [Desulfocicer niacini]
MMREQALAADWAGARLRLLLSFINRFSLLAACLDSPPSSLKCSVHGGCAAVNRGADCVQLLVPALRDSFSDFMNLYL